MTLPAALDRGDTPTAERAALFAALCVVLGALREAGLVGAAVRLTPWPWRDAQRQMMMMRGQRYEYQWGVASTSGERDDDAKNLATIPGVTVLSRRNGLLSGSLVFVWTGESGVVTFPGWFAVGHQIRPATLEPRPAL